MRGSLNVNLFPVLTAVIPEPFLLLSLFLRTTSREDCEYRGVDYGGTARWSFVLGVRPPLALGEETDGAGEEVSYRSPGVSHPFIPDWLCDLAAPPGSSRPSAPSLVYCPIMTLSMATIRLLIARCLPSQWMNGVVMERRICPVVISEPLEALAASRLRVPLEDKINFSYHRDDCGILYLM